MFHVPVRCLVAIVPALLLGPAGRAQTFTPVDPEQVSALSALGGCSVSGTSNCQEPAAFVWEADRLRARSMVADDFIAVGNEIRQICWWAYVDPPPTGGWRVRLYLDDHGLPGEELPESPGPNNIVVTETQIAGTLYQYSFVPAVPIQLPQAGARYWLELSGFGYPFPPPGEVRLPIRILGSDQGNGWFMHRYFRYAEPEPGWMVEDRSQFLGDVAFCVETGPSQGISIPPPQTGACCHCDGTCTDAVAWQDCSGGVDPVSGEPVGSNVGQFVPGRTCTETDCEAEIDLPPVAGDDCAAPVELTSFYPTERYRLSTRCATTDGPTNPPLGPGYDGPAFVNDVWFEIPDALEALLDIDLCGRVDFEPAIAVYSNGTSACPTECPPPDELLLNVESYCSPILSSHCPGPGRRLTVRVPGGDFSERCVKVRVGGQSLAAGAPEVGRGWLWVDSFHGDSAGAYPVEPDRIANASGIQVASRKNRYLSFRIRPGDPSGDIGIAVTLLDLPAPYDAWNGAELWVGPPRWISELPGTTDNTAPTVAVASLQCEPYISGDWWSYGTIHVYHEAVVPNGSYRVEAVDRWTLCQYGFVPGLLGNAVDFVTTEWGDVAGLSGGVFIAPDGSVDVPIDVVGILDKFAARPNAPIKARVDLVPRVPDRLITISDVVADLDAFQGDEYPFAPSAPWPCP